MSEPTQPPPQFSNYPRPDLNSHSNRPPGVYFDSISEAWRLFTAEMGTWILSILAVGFACLLLMIPVYAAMIFVRFGTFDIFSAANNPEDIGRALLSQLVAMVGSSFLFPFYGGLPAMASRQARGEPIGVGDAFGGLKHFLPLLGAGFIYNFLVTIGYILLIIPGVYLTGALALMTNIIVEENMGAVQAAKESVRRLGSDAWVMFVLMVLLVVIVYASMCLCIGPLFTFPIFVIVVGLHYNYYRGKAVESPFRNPDRP